MEKLIDEINDDTVTAEVVMLRADADRTVVIVEGGSDEKLLAAFSDTENLDFVFAHGKERALGAIANLNAMNMRGIVCIVDQDFDDLIGVDNSRPNTIFIDNDAETVLILSGAFDRVMTELGSKSKIQKALEQGKPIRDHIREIAAHLGALRLYSLRKNLGLKFKGISYDFIDRKDFSIDVDDMIKTVADNSRFKGMSVSDLRQAIAELGDEGIADWRIVCGHDLTATFARAFLSFLGSRTTKESTRDDVESRLRLAYSWNEFKDSRLCAQIRKWESNNTNYPVLRAG